ncbi:uncharacterized protein EDB91DRAFT_1052815, partial [Suillus paluster]|uniref:uncharacterized protein n=1 Tax=Suillus paluster TaxID=48578 RepID=UPI001B87E1CD
VPLNKHLHRINNADLPTRPACNEHDETIHYYIMLFPACRARGDRLRSKIPHRILHLQRLLSHPKHVPFLLQFIVGTKRMEGAFGDFTPPEPRE